MDYSKRCCSYTKLHRKKNKDISEEVIIYIDVIETSNLKVYVCMDPWDEYKITQNQNYYGNTNFVSVGRGINQKKMLEAKIRSMMYGARQRTSRRLEKNDHVEVPT